MIKQVFPLPLGHRAVLPPFNWEITFKSCQRLHDCKSGDSTRQETHHTLLWFYECFTKACVEADASIAARGYSDTDGAQPWFTDVWRWVRWQKKVRRAPQRAHQQTAAAALTFSGCFRSAAAATAADPAAVGRWRSEASSCGGAT